MQIVERLSDRVNFKEIVEQMNRNNSKALLESSTWVNRFTKTESKKTISSIDELTLRLQDLKGVNDIEMVLAG